MHINFNEYRQILNTDNYQITLKITDQSSAIYSPAGKIRYNLKKNYMKKEYSLSKGCIATMAEKSIMKIPDKPFFIQVHQVKDETTSEKIIKKMIISDGTFSVRSVYSGKIEVKEFDVVALKESVTAQLKGGSYATVIKDLSLVFTGISTLIGSPQDFNTVKDKSKINPAPIPANAILLQNDFIKPKGLTEEAMADNSDSEEEVKESKIEKTSATKEAQVVKNNIKIRPLKSLGAFSTGWVIEVMLSNKGKIHTFSNKRDDSEGCLLPLEFIDEEGTQISATLFGAGGIEKYDKLLEVGKCYRISRGVVKVANKKYTKIDNDFCLTLDENSQINPVMCDITIKPKVIKYTPIAKIKDLEIGTRINVLGVIKYVDDLGKIRKDDTDVPKRFLRIYDDSNEMISVTLWRDLAQKTLVDGQIVGFTDLKVGEFKNYKQLGSMNSSEIITNPEDERLQLLLEVKNKGFDPPKTEPTKIVKLTPLDNICEPNEEMFGGKKDKYYTISADVVSINYKKGFSYTACSSCNKKITEDKCATCGEKCNPKQAYSFSFQVSDGTGNIFIQAIGDEAKKIIGKTADEMKELDFESKIKIFDSIIGKVFFTFQNK